MNWIVILKPILQALLKKLLESQEGVIRFGSTGEAMAIDEATCQQQILMLESVFAEQATFAAPGMVGTDDGIIAHARRLLDALKARDWTAAWQAVNDIVSHL